MPLPYGLDVEKIVVISVCHFQHFLSEHNTVKHPRGCLCNTKAKKCELQCHIISRHRECLLYSKLLKNIIPYNW